MAKYTWTYDHRIKWDEATILAIDIHKLSRKIGESIEIEKHNTIDQEGKPLDSTWRALFNVQIERSFNVDKNVNNEVEKHDRKSNYNTKSITKGKVATRGSKIAHLNIRSLIKNVDQLRIYLEKQQYDIICINETRLDSTVANQDVNIRGYDIVRNDRNRNGGGVAIYIRSVINYQERHYLEDEHLEAITVEISKPKYKPFLINAWYRPPDTPFEKFENFEDCLIKENGRGK